MRSSATPYWLAALCFALFVAMAIGDIVATSPVFDEPAHLAAGWSYLKTGDFRLNPEHPPLAKSIAAFPLQFMHMWPEKLVNDGSPASGALMNEWGTAREAAWGQWFFAHRLFYALRNDDIGAVPTTQAIPRSEFLNDSDRLFRGARMTMLLTIGGALALIIFFWSREVWGTWGALLSLALFCFDPNFVAHTPLVTTDASLALGVAATLYAFWRCTQKLLAGNLAFFAIAIALAQLTKFSAVLLWPMVIILAMLSPRRFRLLGVIALAGVVSWGVIWAAYGFRFDATKKALPTEQVVKGWYERKGEVEIGAAGHALLWAKEHHLLPESYLHGFAIVQSDAVERGAYLRGRIDGKGFRSYFFWTFLVKTPVATMALMVAALIVASRKRPLFALFALLPVALYLAISVLMRFNIGHRHILLIYPLLYVLCGSLTNKRWLLAAVLSLLSCAFAWGNHIAYFNEIAGGSRNGYKYLIDSNLDWGQDLKRLGRWLKKHNVTEPINLAYSGGADPRYYGIPFVNLELAYVPMPQVPRIKAIDHRLIALSVNMWVFGPNGDTRFYRDYLTRRHAKRIGQAGETIFIYEAATATAR